MVSVHHSVPLFDRQLQIRYFAYSLRRLPQPYVKLDTNRLTLVHFAVQALDLLGVWDDQALQQSLRLSRHKIIDWIYSIHLVSATDGNIDNGNNYAVYAGVVPSEQVGFLGGTFLGNNHPGDGDSDGDNTTRRQMTRIEYQQGHIAMNYVALATLRTLGDDLSRVDKSGIVLALRRLQRPDGSFTCVNGQNAEHDLRFLYCACAVSFFLKDWSGVDVQRATEYIKSCRSFDGAIGLIPGQEGHGGSTFCGTAALMLMGKLDDVMDDTSGNGNNTSVSGTTWRDELIAWCVSRQVGGMQGRPGKAEDTCYSYWIGGTLRLLGGHDRLLQQDMLRGFILRCQSPKYGGFAKTVGAFPDLLHSFYSLAWLSLSNDNIEDDDTQRRIPVHSLNCTLGVRRTTADMFGGQDLP